MAKIKVTFMHVTMEIAISTVICIMISEQEERKSYIVAHVLFVVIELDILSITEIKDELFSVINAGMTVCHIR